MGDMLAEECYTSYKHFSQDIQATVAATTPPSQNLMQQELTALPSHTSPGMVAATLAELAYGSRMAEISKRDIWSLDRVAQERPNVDYKLVATDFLPLR